MLALGVFSTAWGLMIYLWLIREVGANKAITVTYLIPLVGKLLGVLVLDEQVSAIMLVGAVLI